jgi:hypothetical protein
MGFMTKYGSFWGDQPLLSGRVFFVGTSTYYVEGRAYSASDDNDGLSPERAKATINSAVANAQADAGDTICLLPGSFTFTATQTINKAGLRIVGIPGGMVDMHERGTRTTRFPASVTTSASADVFTVTAARTEIAYLHLVPVSAKAGINLAADDCNFHDLTWNITTAANTATFGISVTGASARPRFANHYAYVSDNQGPFLRCASGSAGMDGGALLRSRIILAGTTAWDDVVEITTGVDNFEVADCDFLCSSGGMITTIANVTGNTNDNGVTVRRCMHPVGVTLSTATATSDISLCQNYIATIRGGTGGTLSTGA